MSATSKPLTGRPLTGRKVLLIFVGSFGVIFAVNFYMAFTAEGTFPGLVVDDSYVASQAFNRATAAQRELGWQTETLYADNRFTVTITGRDGKRVPGLALEAVVGHPASDAHDVHVKLTGSDGVYTAPVTLTPGEWMALITSKDASGKRIYESRARFRVEKPL